MIESISAITLATHMQRAVRFYSSLGFEMLYGGEAAILFCPDRPRLVRVEIEQEFIGRVNKIRHDNPAPAA